MYIAQINNKRVQNLTDYAFKLSKNLKAYKYKWQTQILSL